MNLNDTDGHQVGNGLGAEQPNIFTPSIGNAVNIPQSTISSIPDPENQKENSINRAFGGRSRADKNAAQAAVHPSALRQNAPEFFQQSMQQQDIILNAEAEQKKKSKKGLLIGGIIGGVALILICLIVLTISLLSREVLLSEKDKNAISAWNALANFMLTEKESEYQLDTSKDYEDIYSNILNKYSSSRNEYQRWQQFKDSFMSKKENTIFEKDEELAKNIILLEKCFKALEFEVENNKYASKKQVADLYLESGYEDSMIAISDYYNSLENQDIFGLLYEAEEKLAQSYLETANFYQQSGCQNASSNTVSCNDAIKSTAEYNKLQNNMRNYQAKVRQERKTIQSGIAKTAIDITKRIQEL